MNKPDTAIILAYEAGYNAGIDAAAKMVEPGNWPDHKKMAQTLAVAAAAVRALRLDKDKP
jgi:hypothetical protein